MLYREIQPKPPVNRFVECLWTLEGDVSGDPVQSERILPDGCVEMILNFGSHFRELKENGSEENQPLHFVVGQMTRPIKIIPTGPVQVVGIRFHPGGTLPFFRHPMNELTNQVVQLANLDGNIAHDLVARAGDAPFLSQKIAVAAGWLAGRVRDCLQESWLICLAEKIVTHCGQISVDSLAATAGVSGRQLERRFLREVGVGPKLLSRILRFQHVFRAVEQNHEGWAAVAAECGYYDQAHLIRDFQQFAGQTPSVLFAHTPPLTETFTRKNR